MSEEKKTGFFGRLFKRNRLEEETSEEIVLDATPTGEIEPDEPDEHGLGVAVEQPELEDSSPENQSPKELFRLKTGLTRTRKSVKQT
jgi:hypothetical protein